MCCAGVLRDPQLLHRGLRHRRQPTEGGGLSRARLAHRPRSRPNRCSTRLRARLGIDPIELRLKNAVAEGDHAPYGPKYGPIGLKQVLEAARNHPHWSAPLGPNQGRGIACGFWFNAGLNSSATVSLNSDGSATVVAGNPDIGGTRVAQAHDGRGGARHSGRTGAAERRRHRQHRLQRPHGRQPRLLRHRDGGDQGGAGRPRPVAARAAKIWNVDAEQVGWERGHARPLEVRATRRRSR